MADWRAEAAKAIIAAHTGERVVTYDDQSQPSMHDLEIHFTDGRRAAVEVTASEDQRRAGDFGALHKQPVIHDQRLRQGWLVLLKPGASVNLARARLPTFCFSSRRLGSGRSTCVTMTMRSGRLNCSGQRTPTPPGAASCVRARLGSRAPCGSSG